MNCSTSKSSKSMSPELSYFARFASSDKTENASVSGANGFGQRSMQSAWRPIWFWWSEGARVSPQGKRLEKATEKGGQQVWRDKPTYF